MLMKRPILVLALAAASLLASVPTAFAEPFDAKDVAADPALLVHVDCDALRASSVGQQLLTDSEVQDKLAAIAAIFDFDIRTQLHGLTVYTTDFRPKNGSLIVYADFDPKRLITLAKIANEFESVTNGSHVIYSWVDDKKESDAGGPGRVYGAIVGRRVVFGQNESGVADALNVIDGKAPNFSGKGELPQAAAGETLLVQGLMSKFDFKKGGPEATVFKLAKSLRLKLTESGTNLNLNVRCEAGDIGTASELNMVAQGLVALFKLQMNDADALELANAIKINQNGSVVEAALSLPASEAIAAEKKEKAKEEAKATNSLPQNK